MDTEQRRKSTRFSRWRERRRERALRASDMQRRSEALRKRSGGGPHRGGGDGGVSGGGIGGGF